MKKIKQFIKSVIGASPIVGLVGGVIFIPVGIWVIVDSFSAKYYEASQAVIIIMGVFFTIVGLFSLFGYILNKIVK